jgi:hypothetical protein
VVHDEAGHGLGQARDGVEHAGDHAERHPRHAQFLTQQREERRQGELQEVAHHVAGADLPDDAHVVAERTVHAERA